MEIREWEKFELVAYNALVHRIKVIKKLPKQWIECGFTGNNEKKTNRRK
jgi:hypothetical protein